MRWLVLLSFAFLFVGCKDMAEAWWDVIDDDDKPAGLTGGGASTVKLVDSTPTAVEGQLMVISLVRVNPDDSAVSTDYETAADAGATAQAGVDYGPVKGTLRWAPNEGGVKSIWIKLFEDSLHEGSETLFVRFFNQRGSFAVTGVYASIQDKNEPLLFTDRATISVATGGVQKLFLRAGDRQAHRQYLVAGSLGTQPGVVVGNVHVPLNPDDYTGLTLAFANKGPFHNTAGLLDARGRGQAELRVPVLSNSFVGVKLFHAFVTHDNKGTIYMASNAVSLTLAK